MTTAQAASRDGKEKPRDAGKLADGSPKAESQAPRSSPKPEPIAAASKAQDVAPALPVDVTALPDAVLSALLREAQGEMEKRRATKKAEILASIGTRFAAFVAEAMEAGLDEATLENALAKRLRGSKRTSGRMRDGADGRSTVKPKYWSPADHAQRWAGRGVKPKWYADHLAAGGKPEDMLIPEGAV
jgi:DNA-binding protein H-NS